MTLIFDLKTLKEHLGSKVLENKENISIYLLI